MGIAVMRNCPRCAVTHERAPIGTRGVELLRLSSKDDRCWTHWPALRRTIEDAAVDFGQRCIGTVLDRVLATFATQGHPGVALADQDTTAVWYLVDDSDAIVGHLIALQDVWDGERVVYVNQVFAPGVPRALRDMVLDGLDAYTRSRGATRIFMYTRRDCPRFWKAVGFTRYRVLYTRAVKGV